jgi:hypothetical protein
MNMGCRASRRPVACMKTSYQRTVKTVIEGARSPRTRWLFVASLVALAIASAHTLPLHAGGLDYHPSLEVTRTVLTFTLAGLCVGLARDAVNNQIDVGLIGAANGLYAVAVSFLRSGATHGTLLQILIGGLLAAAGAMLGAFLATRLRR